MLLLAVAEKTGCPNILKIFTFFLPWKDTVTE
jgi:hypothetical protein